MEGEGIDREVKTLIDKGGWVDGRGVEIGRAHV